MNNVIPLHRTPHESYEIVVLAASCPDPMTQAVQALPEQSSDSQAGAPGPQHQAQRIIDFNSGSVYIISGYPVKVGKAVFLFTPDTIQIQSRRVG